MFADYYDYDIILYDLILHLAENVPGVPMSGTYDLANDYEGPEFHDFEITAGGKVICGEEHDTEDVDDNDFLTAANKVYGEAGENALYRGLFGKLSSSDINKACDIYATVCGEGNPAPIYDEMGMESDSVNLEDLITLVTEYRDYIWSSFNCTTMCSYVSFLVDTFASSGIDIKFPEELQKVI